MPEDRVVGGLFVDLLPEMAGLVVTPAAIIACLVLLETPKPVRNVVVFATTFVAPYLLLGVAVVLVGGGTHEASDPDGAAVVGLVVGVLFLLGAVVAWARTDKRKARAARVRPAWAERLEDPEPHVLFIAALVLAVLNPNIAILASGISVTVTSGLPLADQLGGIGLLVVACLLDFALPSTAFALGGGRARRGLRDARDWLLLHNGAIGIAVLVVFGVLFIVRGVVALQ